MSAKPLSFFCVLGGTWTQGGEGETWDYHPDIPLCLCTVDVSLLFDTKPKMIMWDLLYPLFNPNPQVKCSDIFKMSKQLFHSRMLTPHSFFIFVFFLQGICGDYTHRVRKTHTTHWLTKFYQFVRNMNFIIMKSKYYGINWISAVIFCAVYNLSQIQM